MSTSKTETTRTKKKLTQAPDFKQVRRYMQTDYQHERLDEFIKAGWKPAELAEYARGWRLYGRTRPAASAYQLVTEWGPEHWEARWQLERMRSPDFVMPPFDRLDDDDPDNPAHSTETRADVEALARRVMARNDDRSWRNTKRGPEAPITEKLWKTCFRDLGGTSDVGLRRWDFRV